MDFSYKFHLTNVDLSRRNEVKTDTLANVN